jgi:hypothetical protein
MRSGSNRIRIEAGFVFARHLPTQEGLLAQRSVAVVPKISQLADHAVTGDQVSHRIVRQRIAHRARRPWSPDLSRDTFVAG